MYAIVKILILQSAQGTVWVTSHFCKVPLLKSSSRGDPLVMYWLSRAIT